MDARGQARPNTLKRDLAAGKVCLGATITMNSPTVAEFMSRVGFDWLWFETEHTSLSLEAVQTMLQATNGAEVSTIVRVPWNDKTMIKRALDLGVDGLILPLVNTAEEAEYAVRAMKYPPQGERGGGLARAQFYGGQMGKYLQSANDEVMTILMIEHIQAVQNIDAILRVKGVDTVMVGALDLSGSMGMLGRTDHPEVEGAIQRVLAACKKASVPCGIIALSPDAVRTRKEQGFRNFIVGIDVDIFLRAAKQTLEAVRPTAG